MNNWGGIAKQRVSDLKSKKIWILKGKRLEITFIALSKRLNKSCEEKVWRLRMIWQEQKSKLMHSYYTSNEFLWKTSKIPAKSNF